jgi:outer membrane protein TolC
MEAAATPAAPRRFRNTSKNRSGRAICTIRSSSIFALDSVKSADAQVTAAREGVDLSEKELAQARRRYEGGVTNSIEVTDAQTRLQRARDNLTIALYNHNLARIDLNTAMGTIQALVDGF